LYNAQILVLRIAKEYRYILHIVSIVFLILYFNWEL